MKDQETESIQITETAEPPQGARISFKIGSFGRVNDLTGLSEGQLMGC